MLVLFSEVRFNNFLKHCRDYPRPQEILHPAVFVLARRDDAGQSEYLNTLEALFACQYNQLSAARRLHIHRTTLFYRLQKIVELTGIRLEDAREMLFLQISVEVFRMLDRPEK